MYLLHLIHSCVHSLIHQKWDSAPNKIIVQKSYRNWIEWDLIFFLEEVDAVKGSEKQRRMERSCTAWWEHVKVPSGWWSERIIHSQVKFYSAFDHTSVSIRMIINHICGLESIICWFSQLFVCGSSSLKIESHKEADVIQSEQNLIPLIFNKRL